MRRTIFVLILATGISFYIFADQPEKNEIPPEKKITAKEIVEKADELLRGMTSYGVFEMKVITPDWNRTLVFETWDIKEDKKAFIRVKSPPKDKGTGHLKIGTNLWMYKPQLEKIIKIPPSMMLQSWMGSDFTNDDLVKESSIVEDYRHFLRGTEVIDAQEAYKLELIPKPKAPVVWGKIIVYIRTEDYIPIKELYYNERGKLIKRLTLSDIKQMGGRRIPTRWVMESVTKENHRTIMIIKEIQFDIEIADSVFTKKNLEKPF